MSHYSGMILGELPPTCHKNEHYFYERFCFIDARGPLTVHENAYFGLGVKVITTSHYTDKWPEFGGIVKRPVSIGDGAWVGSFSILHNCTIHDHAIVSVGAVVNGIAVPEYAVMVGNPAKIAGYMWHGLVLPYERFLEARETDA